MESHTTLCGSLKRHNMRRQYQRLGKVSAKKDKSSRADIGCSQNKYSKIKPKPKKATPKSSSDLLGRLQDAYVEIMLRLAKNIQQLNNGNVFLVQRFLRTPEVPTWKDSALGAVFGSRICGRKKKLCEENVAESLYIFFFSEQNSPYIQDANTALVSF